MKREDYNGFGYIDECDDCFEDDALRVALGYSKLAWSKMSDGLKERLAKKLEADSWKIDPEAFEKLVVSKRLYSDNHEVTSKGASYKGVRHY